MMKERLLDNDKQQNQQVAVYIREREAKSFTELLDEAALSNFHIIMILFCGFAWLCDGLEIAQYSFLFPRIESEFDLTKFDLGMLSSSRSIFSAIGAVAFGYSAEIYGTRRMFMLSSSIFALFSFLSSFSQDYWTLLIVMGIAGFGAGGNMPLALTYVREFFPTRHRDAAIVMMHVWLQMGLAAASGLDWQMQENWRGFLVGTSIPGIFILLFFAFTEEKPQNLLSEGHIDRVKSLLRKMRVPEHQILLLKHEQRAAKLNLTTSLSGMYGSLTIHAFLWFSICAAAATRVWIPEIYENVLLVPSDTYHVIFLLLPIVSFSGFVAIAMLVKIVNPQKLLVWVLFCGLLFTVGIVCILLLEWPSLWFIIMHFFYIIPATCVWSLAAVVTLSNFPSETRSLVMGICAATKSIGAIVSPAFSGWIMDLTTTSFGFGVLSITGCLLALFTALILLSYTKGQPFIKTLVMSSE